MTTATSSPCQIPLSLTEHYASSWKTWEGIREFIQNWYDGIFSSCCSGADEPLTGLRVKIAKEGEYSYSAQVQAEDSSPGVVGRVVYNEKTHTLSLMNCKTALHRRVLLLGYSKKADHHDVIGQFGEGLKVGALALLRCGQNVVIKTSCDCWRFRLNNHCVFEETVLTVFVSGRQDEPGPSMADTIPPCPVELSGGDTCVQIWPLSKKEWIDMAKKFLFLEVPADCVDTELGTLLLDARHQSQLFVKQVWVSDKTRDGLSVGVNFKNIKIDRDRRAVVHQSDIDHQVSSMWVRALKLRPDLAPRYYQLLQQSTACDVRHANYYLQQPDVAALMADEFFKQNGDNSIPVLNTTASETLQQLSRQIEEKVVLCNQSLVEILLKSGRVQSVQELLSTTQEEEVATFSSLTEEQLSILSHAVELARPALPDAAVSRIDVYEGDDNSVVYLSSGRWRLPAWMLDCDAVHLKVACRSQSLEFQCHCAPAFICERLLSSYKHVGDCPVHCIISSLAQQVCGREQPFCQDLHNPSASGGNSELRISVLQDRERELLRRIDDVQRQAVEMQKQHQLVLKDLQTKVSVMEQQQTKDEIKFVDMEQALIEGYRKQQLEANALHKAALKERQEKHDELYSEFLTKAKELEHTQTKLKCKMELVREDKEKYERQIESLKKTSEWYLKRLAERVMSMSQINSAQGTLPEGSEISELIQKLTKQFEDEQKGEVCFLCSNSPKNCVILPCRHYLLCSDCASVVSQCPVCRGHIDQRMPVFSS